ncbi:MAG TPA: type 1 glutamine amidotransferase domain-containing protein [Gemmatirosa sp.]
MPHANDAMIAESESPLAGRRIAVLAADGVEQVELVQPMEALRKAGATIDLVSLKPGEIQAMNHDVDKGDRFPVDKVVADANAGDYDALFVPGGVANPDKLRADAAAVQFVRDFVERDKPVAAICHGPWVLVEADAVRGRTLTSWPSLKTDITNAGGEWQDKEVIVDQKFVTSRKPDDLPAFCDKIVAVFGSAVEERTLDRQLEQTFPASDPLPGPTSTGAMNDKRSVAREEPAPAA